MMLWAELLGDFAPFFEYIFYMFVVFILGSSFISGCYKTDPRTFCKDPPPINHSIFVPIFIIVLIGVILGATLIFERIESYFSKELMELRETPPTKKQCKG